MQPKQNQTQQFVQRCEISEQRGVLQLEQRSGLQFFSQPLVKV
jgi:hypothetical protein